MDSPFKSASLHEVVAAYNLSVHGAENTVVATNGKLHGKRVGELSIYAIRFFARWKIFPETPEAVRRQIAAARVMLAKLREDRRKKRVPRSKRDDDAKRCVATCNSCGQERYVPTKIFDRRGRPRCWQCGGTLQRNACLGESVSTTEAADRLRLTRNSIYRLLDTGVLKGFKRGMRFYISRESVEDYYKLQHAQDGKPDLMKSTEV